MDLLADIVQHLAKKEEKTFRSSLLADNYDRRDIVLFDLLRERSDWKPGELLRKIYTTNGEKAYHSLRDRLKNKLITFLDTDEEDVESHLRNEIFKLTDFAVRMLKRDMSGLANWLLDKAETQAIANHQYDLADRIYEIQLLHIDRMEISEDDLLVKRNENWAKHCHHRELNELCARMHGSLKKQRRTGGSLDPEIVIPEICTKFNLSRSKLKNATFMLRLIILVRSVIASTKEYLKFEPYLIRVFTQLKSLNAFSGVHASSEVGFVYAIAHTLYRNLKFDVATEWLNRMEAMMTLKNITDHHLYGKLMGMRAAIASFSGRNDEAIVIVRTELEQNSAQLAESDRLDLLLNLAVYYFHAEDYKKANECICQIHSGTKSLVELKGREWVFKKELIAAIIYYERNEMELALTRIKAMQRKYGAFLQHDTYQFAGEFLRLFRKTIEKPELIRSQEFAMEVRALSDSWPAERRDLQAITFFCWLKSKVKNVKYYVVLQDWMEKEREMMKGELQKSSDALSVLVAE